VAIGDRLCDPNGFSSQLVTDQLAAETPMEVRLKRVKANEIPALLTIIPQ